MRRSRQDQAKEGSAVWEGEVHVFAVGGHLDAARCYA
jgi:hypothetical protein